MVASVIAIVAARMAANINFLINLTSFAAQTAPARGHRVANSRQRWMPASGAGERGARIDDAIPHAPAPSLMKATMANPAPAPNSSGTVQPSMMARP
ncbi:MAG TPA: hypothetical protein DCF65_02025, partial [Chloroflexi bacterium]|nr:hypothetical protein [Chloroflexota bacterium]